VATHVRPATRDDLPALARLDLTYPAGRVLSLERSGAAPEHAFALRWRDVGERQALYAQYSEARLARAIERAALFLTCLVDDTPAGLLMVLLHEWTDAGEISDLAVGRQYRRLGAGRALVDKAARWARERKLRSLWVEPRADNAGAIEFYVSMGFRLSGFNDRMYSNDDDAPGRTTLFMHLEMA
jgi:ribosomal protein S18 acetylase RimI-like enzyme